MHASHSRDHMVLGAAGIIVFTSTLDVGGGVKAVIVTLAVLIAVYSMARIQPKRNKPGKRYREIVCCRNL